MEPNVVDLRYFKLWILLNQIIRVWNIKGLQQRVLKIFGFIYLILLQRLNSFTSQDWVFFFKTVKLYWTIDKYFKWIVFTIFYDGVRLPSYLGMVNFVLFSNSVWKSLMRSFLNVVILENFKTVIFQSFRFERKKKIYLKEIVSFY